MSIGTISRASRLLKATVCGLLLAAFAATASGNAQTDTVRWENNDHTAYTAGAVAQLAANAGFKGEDLVTAVAISGYESSGFQVSIVHENRDANRQLLSSDYGLWQLNDRYHSKSVALNPPMAAAEAYRTALPNGQYGSRYWWLWSSYGGGSGPYTSYLQTARNAIVPLLNVTPYAPSNYSNTSWPSVGFSWSGATVASSYDLEIYYVPFWTSSLSYFGTFSMTGTATAMWMPRRFTTYIWHVRARAGSATGNWSAWRYINLY